MNILLAVVIAIAAFTGCHKSHEESSSGGGVPRYTVLAGHYDGTINGEPASTFLYKSGDRVYGNMNVGSKFGRVTGSNDPNYMTLTSEASQLGFSTIVLQRAGDVFTVIQGGSGDLTHHD